MLSFVIVACNLVGGTDYFDLVDAQINKTEFSYSASEPIIASFKNISGDDLYLVYPAHSYLEVRENGEWETIGPWYGHIAIAPGLGAFPDGEKVYAFGLKSDEFILEAGKTYRIGIGLYHSNDFNDPLPTSQRATRPFRIVP